ncbi:MAG: phospho-N-acetylmuramoyl-pentapeptide-transferase [Erysipelotrichaceae bacterium]|nr:phospho-N-acetylmuramoyl-pentapeptide-transferase [Erysipelotrichaceae bacterium]
MAVEILIAFVISLAAVVYLMPKWISYLKILSFNQNVSEYSLQEYKEKAKTPIMGGVLFIVVPVIVTIIETLILRQFRVDTAIILIVFAGYGLIGFIDDYLIVVKKNNDGLKPGLKFLMQLALAVIFFWLYRSHAVLDVRIPFLNKTVYFGALYSLLILFMFTGSSNAVNLTDGMDGLAAGCTVFALIPYLVFGIMQANHGAVIFIGSLLGALFGYLKYNIKPAKIFMGDTGSLALGAALAALAMVEKQELTLILAGGVFVIETLCVLIQQISVRTIHKKVFIYTPIHYAFVLKGMGENQVVHMLWTFAAVFAVLGLITGLY